MLQISRQIIIPSTEIDIQAVRAQGPGGQNVNKVSSAVHLRFDIQTSSLPDDYKQSLLALNDRRITSDGVVVIKAQSYRSQEKNRADALERLRVLIKSVGVRRKKRRPTRPSRRSQQKRMDRKTLHGRRKAARQKVDHHQV